MQDSEYQTISTNLLVHWGAGNAYEQHVWSEAMRGYAVGFVILCRIPVEWSGGPVGAMGWPSSSQIAESLDRELRPGLDSQYDLLDRSASRGQLEGGFTNGRSGN